ncbi:bifunctional DNA-formamidopyrimidine glycosylase/DNA-(apurinic or apyrimidinic site) lyase [Leifsonia sp. YAF41]|uniref:bifunctional DNA-formamidopyrimidine glycosylase/DNA-(apurinic or apyrimidinic site) lyase n=1 Tax=Leifsonia sp. YAF41 TaxID=3233086 RepID=UPI003F94FF02
MPELPEVEVVRAGIEPAVTGAVIAGVEIFEPRSLRRHAGSSESFVNALEGQRVHAAVRRGKFLWLPLASGQALVMHLGMSGQVLLRNPGAEGDRMLRIRLHLDHPDHGELWLNFVDQRIFGSMAVDTMLPTRDGFVGGFSGDATTPGEWAHLIPSQVAHIARDPLDPAFSAAGFGLALSRKNTGIKRALLDQALVSGIGNIYADEALFAARLHYAQPANSLSRPKVTRLLAAVREILGKALVEGGTSFDAQYVNVNGESGYFSHSLNAYGQHGTPCPRCGTILVRESFMNRSSHFCPRCQRLR